MPPLLMQRSQHNDAVTRHFNAADELQHVNSVRVNGGSLSSGMIEETFMRYLLKAFHRVVSRGRGGLLSPVSGGVCWNANGRVQLEGTDVTFQI